MSKADAIDAENYQLRASLERIRSLRPDSVNSGIAINIAALALRKKPIEAPAPPEETPEAPRPTWTPPEPAPEQEVMTLEVENPQ
jgi:uncharacterized protein YoaH (UPF0181 family)